MRACKTLQLPQRMYAFKLSVSLIYVIMCLGEIGGVVRRGPRGGDVPAAVAGAARAGGGAGGGARTAPSRRLARPRRADRAPRTARARPRTRPAHPRQHQPLPHARPLAPHNCNT